MKAIIKMALAAMPLLLVACDDDVKEPGKTPAGPGDGIQFTLSAGNESRTMYDDQWNPSDNLQGVYWGNYIASEKDNIRIYCAQAVKNQAATYEVTPNTTGDKSVAAYITNNNGQDGSMQWNTPGTEHKFYAFYPADQAGEKLLDGTENTIRATVATGQSPTSYRGVMGNTVWQGEGTNVLQEVENNSTLSTANKTTVYANPDMSAAIMVAKTAITAKDKNEAVPLNFNVLADVIDITLNGPVTPNQLSGNANPDATNTAVKIYTVTLEAFKTVTDANGTHTEVDDSKVISGDFDLNMETGVVSNPSGNATVQLQTSAIYKVMKDGKEQDVQFYPTLHARAAVTSGAPSADQVDQLRLRAFIIPGSIKNLEELQVRVMTNFGEYVQQLKSFDLNSSDPVQGKIYPIKLGYFYYRGTQFDLSRWVGQLNPNIYLSELSIPGAWHASNTNYQGVAANDLQAQYNAGVRAFEVHTINGITPYTDYKFETKLTTSNIETQIKDDGYYTYHYNEKNVGNISQEATRGSESTITDQYGLYWSGTNMVITQRRTITYQLLPKFALRLYRSRNITSSTEDPDAATVGSFSDALIALANKMNPDGLMFFEFGFERGQTGGIKRPVNVPTKTVTVDQYRTTTYRGTLNGSGPENSIEWTIPTTGIFTDEAWIDEPDTKKISYGDTYQLNDEPAWCIAVESCLNRLKETNGDKTGKPILYTDEVTAETTIKNVQGKVIVKINTNNADNETVGVGWSGNTPALFSRWVNGSASKPLTVNLEWGRPVAPQDGYENFAGGNGTGAPTTKLRWCFSEQDNVGKTTDDRIKAIDLMNARAYANYSEGLHRTFYEISLGGYLGGGNTATEKDCQDLAKVLNPYALQKITNPARNACPLGLVFMNYVVDPNDEYSSKDLIRAIINNNAAFLLNRAPSTPGGTTGQSNLRQNTNSSFDNTTGTLSPLR